jgi:hypothetical protein
MGPARSAPLRAAAHVRCPPLYPVRVSHRHVASAAFRTIAAKSSGGMSRHTGRSRSAISAISAWIRVVAADDFLGSTVSAGRSPRSRGARPARSACRPSPLGSRAGSRRSGAAGRRRRRGGELTRRHRCEVGRAPSPSPCARPRPDRRTARGGAGGVVLRQQWRPGHGGREENASRDRAKRHAASAQRKRSVPGAVGKAGTSAITPFQARAWTGKTRAMAAGSI